MVEFARRPVIAENVRIIFKTRIFDTEQLKVLLKRIPMLFKENSKLKRTKEMLSQKDAHVRNLVVLKITANAIKKT